MLRPKSTAAREAFASRAGKLSRVEFELERELEGELNYTATMLVNHFTKVSNGIASVTRTSIGVSKSARRITGARRVAAGTGGYRNSAVTHRIESQVDIAISQAKRTGIDLGRIRLVEDVEESGSELELRRLSYIEVLKERNIEVASTRSPNIEGRL